MSPFLFLRRIQVAPGTEYVLGGRYSHAFLPGVCGRIATRVATEFAESLSLGITETHIRPVSWAARMLESGFAAELKGQLPLRADIS